MDKKNWLDREGLREIRDSITDSRGLLEALGIRINKETSKEIWFFSPFRSETQASCHINKTTLEWIDFGESGAGGGPLELIQKVKEIDIYRAGRWAVEQGLAFSVSDETGVKTPLKTGVKTEKLKEEKKENETLLEHLSLYPLLKPDHPFIKDRGISEKTCRDLKFGYMPADCRSSLRDRIVFQVRGLREIDGRLQSVLLGHMGRAVTEKQAEKEGKYKPYANFQKSLELYNIDRVYLHAQTREMTERHGLLLMEGCFDVAKLHEAGILNSVAIFGSSLSSEQAAKLKFLSSRMAIPKITLWLDRDLAGYQGTNKACNLLEEIKPSARVYVFDWEQTFDSSKGAVPFPENLKDAGNFSVEQLQFLRGKKII